MCAQLWHGDPPVVRQRPTCYGACMAMNGRLSVRLELDDLKWAAEIGASVGQDSSWAIRWAVAEMRRQKLRPVLKTVGRDEAKAARKAGL